MRTVVWFRDRDLRVADHPALDEAAAGELIPVYVREPSGPANPHRQAFLARALEALAAALGTRGSGLVTVAGPAAEVLPALAATWKVEQVLALRETDPAGRERDLRVQGQLGRLGIPLRLLEGQTLLPPGALRNGKGEPYRVFTPFARAFLQQFQVARPQPPPRSLPPLPAGVPAPMAAAGGAAGALERMAAFLDGPIGTYLPDRDRPDLPGSSRLSADLACGILSPRTLWHAAGERLGAGSDASVHTFRKQLLWREFAHQLLLERPELLTQPFRPAFAGFPWRRDLDAWSAWTQGRTGYPMVDAAARQLLAEGFVHNRARMVAACFLAKDLMLPYQQGEAHYLAWLADADPACNNLGWQWSAGCGCDAQPWFRVFNPVTQGQRFDPQGGYVRRWLPELAALPAKWIHQPWAAPADVLARAGVTLGVTYENPIIDHGLARRRFLDQAKAWLG